jgi:hypothetical protein
MYEQLGVGPRPDGERHVNAAAAEMFILLQCLLHKQVLPAADHQHRHLHPVQRVAELQEVPERVAASRRLQPGLPPRRAGAQQLPSGRS